MSEAVQGTGEATTVAGGTQENAGVAGEGTTAPATTTAAPAATTAEPAKVEDGSKTTEVAYDLKMPEGVELDKAAADEFTTFAKDAKLTPEQAQKVADIGAAMIQRQAQQFATTIETWQTAVKTDPEIGGDKLDATLASAKSVLATFGKPELTAVLDQTGLGNHPELIRLLANIGKKMSPDTFVGGKQEPVAADPAKLMYPSMA